MSMAAVQKCTHSVIQYALLKRVALKCRPALEALQQAASRYETDADGPKIKFNEPKRELVGMETIGKFC